MKQILTCAVLLALAAGCDATATHRDNDAQAELNAYFGAGGGGGFGMGPGTRAPPPRVAVSTPTRSAEPDDSAMDWADSCASNLEELTGALLLYFSAHRQLPPTLEQIPRVSPGGQQVSLSCPESGKRYIYYPQGLRPPIFIDQDGNPRVGNLLVLYDAEASHRTVQHLTDGTNEYDLKKPVHFGIVMEPRVLPNQPVQLFVVPIEKNLLDVYLKNAATTATPALQPRTP